MPRTGGDAIDTGPEFLAAEAGADCAAIGSGREMTSTPSAGGCSNGRHRPLEVRFPARPAQLAPARAALRDWLTTSGVGTDLAGHIVIAAGEAMSNAVEHGHRDDPDGLITLRATLADGVVHLIVTDTGRWRIPERHDSRGTAFMNSLMDTVEVEPTPGGTTVRMSVGVE